MKYLVNLAAEDFVQWLVQDAQFEGELSTNFASQDLDGDILWQISISKVPTLLHLEFQAEADATMGRRLWEYNTQASIKYKQAVKSIVVYLKTPGSQQAKPPYQVKLPNGEIIHNFAFSVVELCQLRADQLFQTGLKGLLPLVPLTREGQRHDSIERIIDEIQQPGVRKQEELLSLTFGFAGLSIKEEDEQLWLQRRFAMLKDILEESWTFQKIRQESIEKGLDQGLKKGLQQGLEQGLEQGLKKGLQQGLQQARGQMLQVQRQSLLLFIQAHYPALLEIAQETCNFVQTPEAMQGIFQKLLLAKTEAEVHQCLLSIQK